MATTVPGAGLKRVGQIITGISVLMGVVGLVLLIVGGMSAVSMAQTTDYKAVTKGVPTSVTLEAGSTRAIYAGEQATTCTVANPSGQPVTVTKPAGTQTIESGGTKYYVIGTIQPTAAGAYTFTCTGLAVVGPSVSAGMVGGMVGGIFLLIGGFFGLVVGIILWVVGANKAKSATAPTPIPYGAQPTQPAPPGAYPHQGPQHPQQPPYAPQQTHLPQQPPSYPMTPPQHPGQNQGPGQPPR